MAVMDSTNCESSSAQPQRFRTGQSPEEDAPGDLSKAGRRHDNDHADICDISILPTAMEIQSHRSEYLPAAIFSTHKNSRIEGLLDRQFRLLREDSLGFVRDEIKHYREKIQCHGLVSREKVATASEITDSSETEQLQQGTSL